MNILSTKVYKKIKIKAHFMCEQTKTNHVSPDEQKKNVFSFN